MATWSNILFQDSASPLMEQLIFFHDHSLMILILITSLVSYLFYMLLFNLLKNRLILDGQEIETIWTLLPAIILLFIAFPSLRLLYMIDEINVPSLTIKSIGHQWFWSYEYSDFNMIEFDSYMIQMENDFTFRLLDVDNRLILPLNIQLRLLITANDVLHAWAVPSLGVKSDAVPGRLNQISFLISRPGLWYGQCSEICGANHSFMPIVLESISQIKFLNWIKNFM